MKLNRDILSERAIGNYFKTLCAERKYRIVKLFPAQTVGIPDRMLLTRNGVTIFIELKSEGKSRSPMQERWGQWLEEANQLYLLIDKVTPEMHDVIEIMFDIVDGIEAHKGLPEDVLRILKALNEVYGKPTSIETIRRLIKKG